MPGLRGANGLEVRHLPANRGVRASAEATAPERTHRSGTARPAPADAAVQRMRRADDLQNRHLPAHRRMPQRGGVLQQGLHEAAVLRWLRGPDAVALQVAVLHTQPAVPATARHGSVPRRARADARQPTTLGRSARAGDSRPRTRAPPAARGAPSQSSRVEQPAVGRWSSRVLFCLWTVRRLAKAAPAQAPPTVSVQGAWM